MRLFPLGPGRPGAFDRDSPHEEGHFAGTRRTLTNQKLCQSGRRLHHIEGYDVFVFREDRRIAPRKGALKTATAPPAK